MSGVYPLRSKWLEEVRRSKDKGGLDLEYLPAICSSFFPLSSFMRPMGENFDHQTRVVQVIFGMCARRFNSMILLSEPHSFQLQGVYKNLQ